jgi:hypothetical protein
VQANQDYLQNMVNDGTPITRAPERKMAVVLGDNMRPGCALFDFVKAESDTLQGKNHPSGHGFIQEVHGLVGGGATIFTVKHTACHGGTAQGCSLSSHHVGNICTRLGL